MRAIVTPMLTAMLTAACVASAALAQTNPPAGPKAPRAGKPDAAANPIDRPNNDALASCISQWDKATHMTRTEWDRACRRVANRIQNLSVK